MKTLLILSLCTAATAITSCGGNGNGSYDSVSIDLYVDENSPAFDLGQRCAERLLQDFESETAIRDELLDIRAREHSLRCRVGAEAADSYVAGFKTKLKESGDTLYRTLFE